MQLKNIGLDIYLIYQWSMFSEKTITKILGS